MTLQTLRGTALLFSLACSTLAPLYVKAARADELKDPPIASSAGVLDLDERGCGLANPTSVVRARLVVRNTLRPIGPYLIQLPAYASSPDPLPPDGVEPYGPYQIKAKPGDTLRIDLVNGLQDAETIPQTGFQGNQNGNANIESINLHTHGLIVKPRPYGPCGSLGDYIFNQVDWTNTAKYRIDIPQRVAGAYLNAPKNDPYKDGKGPFPVGPYWIHAHLHGQAKPSVLAGQSAFLSIDCPDPNNKQACPNGAPALGLQPDDVKIMALRDVQTWVDADHTPDKFNPPYPAINSANAFFVTDDYAPGACEPSPPVPRASAKNGYCVGPAAHNGKPGVMGDVGVLDANNSPSKAPATTAWLFTVNGQYFPNVTLGPKSKKQLWRFANMSPVVTYRLHLVKHPTGKPDEIVKDAFKVVSVDGVLAGSPSGAPGDFTLGRSTNELVLTPATRAEVVVTWSGGAADETWTLENERFCTGSTDSPTEGCSADPWPTVALASVTMQAAPAVLTMAPAAAAQPAMFSRKTVSPSRVSTFVPANCIGLPKAGYRTIRFEQDQANFFIGPLDTDAGDEATRLADVHSFRHDNPPGMRRHICVEGGLGRAELWLLQNDTDELHNFHIHQSKFRLATDRELAEAGVTDVVHDPSGLLTNQTPELAAALQAESKAEGAVWHDTIPVPPRVVKADGFKDMGHTAIVIPFSDENQIGTFVYHCHILEHEDGGMMGVVEVYNPKGPHLGAAESGVKTAGFCGQPPAGFTPIPARTAEPGWRERLAALTGL